MRYSGFRLLKEALTGNKGWTPAWRDPDPKAAYDVIVIGGGGHGLATAYYLAKEHGLSNIAVLERGLIGMGNTGRNTTIVRSHCPERRRACSSRATWSSSLVTIAAYVARGAWHGR